MNIQTEIVGETLPPPPRTRYWTNWEHLRFETDSPTAYIIRIREKGNFLHVSMDYIPPEVLSHRVEAALRDFQAAVKELARR